MTHLQNYAFDDHLVRIVMKEDEPWFVANDVCAALGIKKPRTSIDLLPERAKDAHTVGTPGGPQEMIIISEPGMYRLVFKSRRPEAEKFVDWVVEDVLPAIRRAGYYELPDAALPEPAAPGATAAENAPLSARVEAVRLARSLYGPERARALWHAIGMPSVPPAAPTSGQAEARACLRHLLEQRADDGSTLRELIERSLEGDEEARLILRPAGIHVRDEEDGFCVANSTRAIVEVFAETEWNAGRFARVLRRLPGACAGGTRKYAGHASRGTWLPGDCLDDDVAR